MKKHIYKDENYRLSKWSGGTTRELAIYPESAEYLDRDFLWRLSSADSDKEESSFTKLPDYDRILMVLEGSVVLAHGDERTVNLGAFESDAFDGAVKTKCFGQLKKDYNLIYRKGTRGRMELIELTDQGREIECAAEGCRSIGVYSADGYAVVTVNGQTEMVREDQQMVIDLDPEDEIRLSVMGRGRCIFTEVAFEREEVLDFSQGFAPAEGEETARGGGESDFMIALKLSLSNNRWSTVMNRMKKKGTLHSPAMEEKLRFLDRFFVTGIVWAAGVIICLMLLMTGMSNKAVFGIVILFTIVDILLISPLIYLAVLPKPLSAHIKKSEDLNAYEQKIFEDQINYDPRHEKLMHKYRDRKGETYKGAADFWRKMNKDD
ncbi:MAG: HutD/Ves family protein [Bacillota bacterium]